MIDAIALVESNSEIAPGYRLLVLRFNQVMNPGPGQFAMIRARDSFEPLLRRALAVYRVLGPDRMSFLYHVLGRGTVVLATLRPGDQAQALVPLGNIWPLPVESSVEDRPNRAIVVAGGIGSVSLLMLCEQLARSGHETRVFFGAASKQTALGCGLDDFRETGLPVVEATDDGSLGERGFITEPLDKYLRDGGGERAIIYSCGPWAMMKRVAELARKHGVRCLVSLEAPMGCGFGVCVGCVVAVNNVEGGYHSYKRVCVDGSILPADLVRWDVNAMSH